MGNHLTGLIAHPLRGRTKKPREKGITMVLDKGLGLGELDDLLTVAGEYLDFLKLGFGTSLLYKQELLKAKIKLCHQYRVEIYPGGTLTEIAIWQGKYDLFLEQIQKIGFTTIEISDGIISLSPANRKTCLQKAKRMGFRVLTELGKKIAPFPFSASQLGEQGQQDLAHGAWKIIMEARESGKNIGIYNEQGIPTAQKIDDLLKHFPTTTQIIWEAPLKNQQIALIQQLGPNVNLGNIQAMDLLALEALRTGLRADTLILAPDFSPEIYQR